MVADMGAKQKEVANNQENGNYPSLDIELPIQNKRNPNNGEPQIDRLKTRRNRNLTPRSQLDGRNDWP